MPELTILSSLWTMLRGQAAALHRRESRELGATDIVTMVVVTAIVVVAAIAIVTALMNRVRDKATSIPLE